jgi:lauroyl/myristoyl acyltransferase
MQTQADTTLAPPHSAAPPLRRPLVRVKDLAWLIYLYPARWLALILPLRLLYALGDVAAVCASGCLRRPRQALLERLAPAFDTTPADPRLRAIADQFFRNAILRFLDDLLMERLFRQPRLPKVELVHLDNLTQALSAGRGALLVGNHWYAGRMAKRYLATIGFPILAIGNHAPEDRHAGWLGKRFLQKRYMAFLGRTVGDFISTRDPDCSLKMLARLRSGGLVRCLVDTPQSQALVESSFLGQKTVLPAGFLHVARLAGCPLVPLHCLGHSRHLTVVFGKPLLLQSAPDQKSFAERNLAELHRILEQQIKDHPAEWDGWIRW